MAQFKVVSDEFTHVDGVEVAVGHEFQAPNSATMRRYVEEGMLERVEGDEIDAADPLASAEGEEGTARPTRRSRKTTRRTRK